MTFNWYENISEREALHPLLPINKAIQGKGGERIEN